MWIYGLSNTGMIFAYYEMLSHYEFKVLDVFPGTFRNSPKAFGNNVLFWEQVLIIKIFNIL